LKTVLLGEERIKAEPAGNGNRPARALFWEIIGGEIAKTMKGKSEVAQPE